MDMLNEVIVQLNDQLWAWIGIPMLVGIGIYFTILTRGVQFRHFGEMWKLLFKNSMTDEQKEKGNISSFQAFCISTAARVGTGNIIGVAIAISLGGPGSIFWMSLVALLGASTSFVESTLAQLYKERVDGNTFVGGPAFYMKKGLQKHWLGIIFAFLMIVGYGFVMNAVQANAITTSIIETFHIDPVLVVGGLALLSAFVIFGGVHRIAKISEVIVPVMAVAYLVVALFVIGTNIQHLPAVLKLIIENAFGLEQIAGGTIGGVFLLGVKRGLFSNEAGMGSAPNAAATAETSHPAKQGFIQTLSVFIDTVLICNATAFMILLPTLGQVEGEGVAIVLNVLNGQFGAIGGVFLSICIFFFAFSSLIGGYFYGESNVEFLTKNKHALLLYRLLVVGMVTFGASAEVAIVWNLADLFMPLMAIINLIAVVLLGKYALALLKNYEQQKREGKDPVFVITDLPEIPHVTEWQNK
ncbi:MAG: alanine/glycine:cation symporter family protein [Culicoidibacterales bacterium]